MNEIQLPDFIIIGAMKCATSSLHDQLSFQSGIHMSTPKEPNFFSDDAVFAKGLSWYSQLFSRDNETINGESSTHYSKYPDLPETWSRMKSSGIDKQKFIYVLRDPIERLTSHYIHQWSQGVIHCDIDSAIEKHSELIDYSKYSMQLQRALEFFPKEQFLIVFSERFKSSAQEELELICDFIGYKKRPLWETDISSSNVSSKRVRKFPLYDILIESQLTTFLRRALVPKSIRTKVRNSLTMKHRPELSTVSLDKLRSVFNEDLTDLSKVLGVELNVENFRALSQQISARSPI